MMPPPDKPQPETAASESSPIRNSRRIGLAIVALMTCTIVITLLASIVVMIAALPDDERPTHVAQPRSTWGSELRRQGSATRAQPPSKVLELAQHPLLRWHDVGLPIRACQLPSWDDSEQATRSFFRAATNCLNEAWSQLLHSRNLPFTRPRLYFPEGKSFRSDCGHVEVGSATAAYYCEGELFLPFRGLQKRYYGDSLGVYLALIAHEYGHHVQELSGIMDAVSRKINGIKADSPKAQEMSRRKELQAQCFSGMFLAAHVDRGGSITSAMYAEAWQDQMTRGDDASDSHTHGSKEHYAMWYYRGLNNRISDCNTFNANRNAVR